MSTILCLHFAAHNFSAQHEQVVIALQQNACWQNNTEQSSMKSQKKKKKEAGEIALRAEGRQPILVDAAYK